MKTFYDIESEKIVSVLELHNEYTENRKSFPEEFNYSFSEYVNNCLTINNGTLEVIEK